MAGAGAKGGGEEPTPKQVSEIDTRWEMYDA
jgi:hypothetical protein